MTGFRFTVAGRLAWPPVVLVAFHCLFVVLFDYAWRTVNAPFEWLLLGAAVAWLVTLGLLLVLFRRIAQKRTAGL
ncbi:hypothetical protein [Salinisphaera dokdonensis]|uniref:hypothetical protein n=1 Tax=Salinisphaera dokdonensis TaxID=454598 RepID=UPI003341C109